MLLGSGSQAAAWTSRLAAATPQQGTNHALCCCIRQHFSLTNTVTWSFMACCVYTGLQCSLMCWGCLGLVLSD